jgi:hypothetical protein
MQRTILVGLFLSVAGCGTVETNVEPAIGAHDVEMVAIVTRRAAGGDSVVIQIRNYGPDIAFVSRCGAGPLLLTQQFVNGEWTGGVQNFACPVSAAPGPIRLGPGEHLLETRLIDAAGRFRFRTPVGTSDDLADASQAVSNSFNVP